MTHDEDRDLKAAFQALGSRVHGDGTSFQHLTSPEALRSWKQQRRVRQGVLAFVLVLASVQLRQARSGQPIDYEGFVAATGLDLGAVTWEAPSDFLLDVPGRDLLEHVPTIDVQIPLFVPDSTPRLLPNDSQRRSRL